MGIENVNKKAQVEPQLKTPTESPKTEENCKKQGSIFNDVKEKSEAVSTGYCKVNKEGEQTIENSKFAKEMYDKIHESTLYKEFEAFLNKKDGDKTTEKTESTEITEISKQFKKMRDKIFEDSVYRYNNR